MHDFWIVRRYNFALWIDNRIPYLASGNQNSYLSPWVNAVDVPFKTEEASALWPSAFSHIAGYVVKTLWAQIQDLMAPVALRAPRAVAGIALETIMAFNAMSVLLSRYDAYWMFFSREFPGEAPSFFSVSNMRQRPPFGSLKDRVSVRKLQKRGTPY
jgi:hypothetical protein